MNEYKFTMVRIAWQDGRIFIVTTHLYVECDNRVLSIRDCLRGTE